MEHKTLAPLFLIPSELSDSPPLTLRQHALYRVRNAIITGQLEPGEQLKESRLAQQLGTSATPLREALLELASDGLITIEPNKRKRVAPLNVEEMVQLLKVKVILWRAGIEWGAPRCTTEDIERIDRYLERYKDALQKEGSILELQAAVRAIQSIIMLASGNAELDRLAEYRMALVARFEILCMPQVIGKSWLKAYRKIRDAIATHDVAAALKAHDEITAELITTAEKVRDGFLA